ncbi:MAG: FAD-dependent monooxygenase [Proteobacteria bacterium]|nr:FAD-dependent monooxygenase [Pseudomonadota bacterium]
MTKVIIVGGGIGGISLAHGLKKYDVDCVVYDKASEFKPWGSSFALMPNGRKALEDISPSLLAEATAGSIAQDKYKYGMYGHKGDVIGSPYHSKDGPKTKKLGIEPGFTMRRSLFHQGLVDALEGVPVNLKKKLVRFESTADKIEVFFEDGEQVEGDVLVGADGVHSTVRRTISPATQLHFRYPWVAGTSMLPDDWDYPVEPFERKLFYGYDGCFFFSARTSVKTVEWGAVVPENREYTVPELAALYSDFLPEVLSMINTTPQKELHTFETWGLDLLPAWSSGRVVLLGDSAHPVSQVVGQGASLAVEDARRLAMELSVLKDTGLSSVVGALKNYELRRRKRVDKIVTTARSREKYLLLRNHLACDARNLVLKLLWNVFDVDPSDWFDPNFDKQPGTHD